MGTPSFRKLLFLLVSGVTLLAGTSQNARAATILFDQANYSTSVGVAVPVTLSISYASGETMSLFSYGVKMNASFTVQFPSIQAVAPLDFNGLSGPGAVEQIDTASGAVKGTVENLTPYVGADIATFQVQFDTPGTYSLTTEFFNTLGPTEQIFVTGTGSVLDDDMVFGSATITVVPEPSVSLLMMVGLVCLMGRRRRGSH